MIQVVAGIALLMLIACLGLIPFALALRLAEAGFARSGSFSGSAVLLLLVRSLLRNRMRTALTFVATFVLVFVVSGIWSVLYFLDQFLSDKGQSPRVVISEKWQLVSQMPLSYAASLSEGAARRPGDVRPIDAMTWQLYLGTTDPANPSPDNSVPCIAMQPGKVLTMLDDLFEELATDRGAYRNKSSRRQEQLEASVHQLETNRRGILLGSRRLAALNKQIGERITLAGLQYRNIDLEFEIVGVLPVGRYSDLAIMHRDYLNDAFDDYARKRGVKHPLASKSLSMVWLRLREQEGCARVAEQIEASGLYQDPPVKCQTLSAAAAAALDAFADLLWGLRWLVAPAILVIMTLVMANAIGISVRERAPEMALLKVLGFGPGQVLWLILGESMLIGALAGLLSALFSRVLVNNVLNQMTGNVIDVPLQVLWWCPAAGLLTGLVGSAGPAWSACRVKAARVFARAV